MGFLVFSSYSKLSLALHAILYPLLLLNNYEFPFSNSLHSISAINFLLKQTSILDLGSLVAQHRTIALDLNPP